MQSYTTVGLIVVVVVAICEAAKYAGLQSRWTPLLSLVLGMLGVFWFDGVNFLSSLAGVVLGLSATGGYRLVKTTILNK